MSKANTHTQHSVIIAFKCKHILYQIPPLVRDPSMPLFCPNNLRAYSVSLMKWLNLSIARICHTITVFVKGYSLLHAVSTILYNILKCFVFFFVWLIWVHFRLGISCYIDCLWVVSFQLQITHEFYLFRLICF